MLDGILGLIWMNDGLMISVVLFMDEDFQVGWVLWLLLKIVRSLVTQPCGFGLIHDMI